MSKLSAMASAVLGIAREASEIVMRVYQGPFDVEYKGEDDPVTRADRESNALVCERLSRAFPGVPVVAEESHASEYAGFASAEAAWFVDPLDGTREFIARNGEFAVMIGLAERGRARLGVIVAPAWGRAFVGVVGEGAWEVAPGGAMSAIRVTSRDSLEGASIVVSRSRAPARLAAFVNAVGARAPTLHGSSGLKAALIATGAHDAYVHPGSAGMRWDACASEALVRAAGGECTDADAAPFDYATDDLSNRSGLVATNGRLHGAVIQALRQERGA